MLKLVHHDDGKGNYQSHCIYFEEFLDDLLVKNFTNGSITGYDIGSAFGYGSTKEEALENFKESFYWLLREYEAIGKLWDMGHYQDNIIEVDCFGVPLDPGERNR